ncbi:MAG: LysM peptidoglycan-binding domain-containing protein [Candidatus Thiodiazotropha sp. (ex Epidulcina cf. delphinae)]|nr:LysM peptidoglycan-binding domain-containing protein [Candidatus Thiodiazotropha sp. (ex Epidulcina cf. delphinae)]
MSTKTLYNSIRHPKLLLLIMSLFFACLLTACQTLPNGGTQSALEEVPLSQLATEALRTHPTPETAHVTIQKMPQIAEELQTVVAALPVPEQPRDLWSRMLDGYSLSIPPDPRVGRELNWYSNHPGYIERIQLRAEPYLHFILEEIDKRGMPGEIALLPAVESAFQPFAYSPGRAAGMWQFIPSTGRYFGLKQNWWYDGRRDVVASTRAALDYLKALSRQFDGDWELALAAYNSGAGTVRNAIKRNRKRGKATDFWSLKLPDETSAYVPRLLALAEIFRHPQTHGVTLQVFPDEPYFTTIDIDSQLDLALAAEMADLPIQDLYLLNAGFNRWATDPDGPHQLTLPLDKVESFLVKLKALPAEKRLTWKRYKIKQGDSLSVIARKHGTTSKLLRQVNKLRGNRIRAGRHLLIPVSSKSLDQYAYSAEQRKSAIQNRPRSGQKQHYIVKPGDSLWKIARTHHVNHKKLAAWNGMAPGDTLKPGQKLVIWVKKAPSSELSLLNLQPTGTQSKLHYKVRRGDSLSRIAQRFKVSISDLKRWNTLNSKYLQPGQRLKLYVDVTEQTL